MARYSKMGRRGVQLRAAHSGTREPAPTRLNAPSARARVPAPSRARLIARCAPKRALRPCTLVHAPLRRAATCAPPSRQDQLDAPASVRR